MHVPVLGKEVIEYLDPKPDELFIDCTVGQGGHARMIIDKGASVIGIDQDPLQIEDCKNINNLKLVNDSYANLKDIIGDSKPDGILLDLGMSSRHLESGRGFSFRKDEPLDMRYGDTDLTAEEIVNHWEEEEIERILKDYGEEKFAKRIAREIVRRRPIKTTFQLVETLIPYRDKIHFATKTFQALRIAVNKELENVEKVLPQAVEVLKPGGKLVIISFHSLEDRIVKNYFKQDKRIKILTKKPIAPSFEEIKDNPRARSAKLRVAIKI